MIEYQPGSEGRYSNAVIAKALISLAADRGRESSEFLAETLTRMLSDKNNTRMYHLNVLIARTIHNSK